MYKTDCCNTVKKTTIGEQGKYQGNLTIKKIDRRKDITGSVAGQNETSEQI